MLIDLGCGKGAAAILAARTLGCRVRGIDACAPFVEYATRAAARAGVADRCEFMCADLRRAAGALRPASAAMMLGVLPIEDAAPMLKSLVVRGGIILLDDAIVLERRAANGDRPTRTQAREFLRSLGLRIEREHVIAPAEYRCMEQALYSALSGRARDLCRRIPRLAPAVDRFLGQQRKAAAQLWRGPVRGAMWMARVL